MDQVLETDESDDVEVYTPHVGRDRATVLPRRV